ncbi:MAG: protein-disulfide reductase DsbD family protein [Candidatus Sumerlaeota bacterium]|nr:protein-disulfide reductase DsbD family protein [Candidatus Sumerlaeota bacterium]
MYLIFRSTKHLFSVCVLLAGITSLPAAAKDEASALVAAELVSEDAAVTAGQPFWVALQMKTAPGVHIYWKNPGDAGLPPSLEWKLPEGFAAGPIQWPTPTRIRTGESVGYCLEGDVYLLIQITPPQTTKPGTNIRLEAATQWLACKTQCVPGNASLSLELPIQAAQTGSKPPKTSHAPAFEKARALLPQTPEGWSFALSEQTPQRARLTIRPPEKVDLAGKELYFYCDAESVIDPNAAQTAALSGGQAIVTLKKASSDTPRISEMTGILAIYSPASGGAGTLIQSIRVAAK